MFTKVLLCHSLESAPSRAFCHILIFSKQVLFYLSFLPVPPVSPFNIFQLNFLYMFFFSISCFKCVPPPRNSSFNDPVSFRLRVQVLEVIIVQFVCIICLLFLSWVKMLSSAHSQIHICRHLIVTVPAWGNINL